MGGGGYHGESETIRDRMGARNEPEEGGGGGDRTGSREVRKRESALRPPACTGDIAIRYSLQSLSPLYYWDTVFC